MSQGCTRKLKKEEPLRTNLKIDYWKMDRLIYNSSLRIIVSNSGFKRITNYKNGK